jgi:excisionase family DNA binding protein
MRDNSADTALALPFNQSQALEAINAATTNLGATIAAAFSEQLAEAVQRTRPVKMLSAPEAARRAGVSVQMIRVAIKDKRLTAHKGIGGGLGKVKSSDLDDFIRNL